MPATPASPRLQQVRQQLDDLDALLERMLALPLDAPPPSGPKLQLHSDPLTLTLDQAAQAPPPAVASPPEPPAAKQEAVEEAPAIVPFRPEPEPSPVRPSEIGEQVPALVLPPTENGVNDTSTLSLVVAEEPLITVASDEPEKGSVSFPTADAGASENVHITPSKVAYPDSAPFASIEEKPGMAPLPSPWGLRPFQALNALFDGIAEKGGPVSRWAKSPLGKQLFGGTGVLLCVAAAALALGRWLGLMW